MSGCTCVYGAWFGTVPPPPCPVHTYTIAGPLQYTPIAPAPVSDADVDRIAQRVAEILRGGS